MKKKVIVLGCAMGGLAAIRALGQQGLHVIAISFNANDIGFKSKYVGESVVCPHPNNLDDFRDFMVEKASEWSGTLIVETSDLYAKSLSMLKSVLSQHYRFVTPDWEVLSLFIEKENTYKLAEACNVRIPKTFYPESLEHLVAMEDEIRLPCIIKPVESHEFVARFDTKLFEVDTFGELVEKYELCINANLPVILQEIIPGDDTTYERVHIYRNSKGEPGAEVYHKTVRLNPPKYGVMRVGATVPPLEEAREFAHRLLDNAGFRHGVACFQFKRHAVTGELTLIEVNGRIPRSLQIDTSAGVNLPWIIYQDLIEGIQLPVSSYRETTYIEFLPDVLNALARDDRSHFSVRSLLAPYMASNKAFAVLSLTDPKPFLKQMSNFFGGKLKGRASAPSRPANGSIIQSDRTA